MQRSTVKASYARNRHGTSWGAHGVYLSREGAQRDGERGVGFDTERDDIDVAATLRTWQAAGDERLWKFVVSPEHAANLNLQEHARELVGRMQHDLGSRLEWVAIDHYNTDNPHVHLLVRGRDLDGHEVRIPRDYLTSGLRQRSQELATQRLGLRSDREILAARSYAAERTRFTELDRTLLRRADTRGIVSYREAVPRPGPRRELYTHELRRLQFLEVRGLAEKIDARAWRLSPVMEAALRQAQLATDIIKSRARHRAHLSDARMPIVLTRLDAGTYVAGRFVGSGWTDELQRQRYLMVEGTDRQLHYIPQSAALEGASEVRQLRPGDLVTLSSRGWVHQGRKIVQTEIRRIEPLPPIGNMSFRGRLIGHARGRDNQRYAVVQSGPDVMAFRTDATELVAGREIRVKTHSVQDGQRWRQLWRLAAEEHERQRGREL